MRLWRRGWGPVKIFSAISLIAGYARSSWSGRRIHAKTQSLVSKFPAVQAEAVEAAPLKRHDVRHCVLVPLCRCDERLGFFQLVKNKVSSRQGCCAISCAAGCSPSQASIRFPKTISRPDALAGALLNHPPLRLKIGAGAGADSGADSDAR